MADVQSAPSPPKTDSATNVPKATNDPKDSGTDSKDSGTDKDAEKKEQDKKLAQQMTTALERCLDKVKPICDMITQVRAPPPA